MKCFERVFEVILNNINAEYYIDTLIDKETLLPDYMNFDLSMQIDLKPLIEIIVAMEEVDEN